MGLFGNFLIEKLHWIFSSWGLYVEKNISVHNNKLYSHTILFTIVSENSFMGKG